MDGQQFLEEFLAAGRSMAQDSEEDGFVTLKDKDGNPYKANLNESEKERYAETKKPLSQVKKEQKEKEIERGKKLSDEDVNSFYEKKKTLADMRKWFSGDDYMLTDDDVVKIWYKDGSFDYFDGREIDDISDFKKALKKSGIKAVTLESGWGMTYYGNDDDIIMRNAESDEPKTMADLKKDGIYEDDTWFVDKVK